MYVNTHSQPTDRYDWALREDEIPERNDWGCAIYDVDGFHPEIEKWMALGKLLWAMCDGGRAVIDLSVLVDQDKWGWLDVERGTQFLQQHGFIKDHTEGVATVRDVEIVWVHQGQLGADSKPYACLLDQNNLWITVEEAAELFDVCTRTAYEAVRDGSLPSFRIGRQYRIPMAGIRSLLALNG